MLSPDQIIAFLVAAVLLTATPGPDNLMVLGVGMSKGRGKGVAFGLGCAAGCLSHTLLAVLGVSALVAASPMAFTALKVVGGLYLVWLGIGALRSKGGSSAATQKDTESNASSWRFFFKGMVANAINPKVVLFFLSFLPQFVAADRGEVGLQLALLGVLFTVQAAVLFGTLGWFSGTVGAWLGRRPRASLWLDRLAGVVFVGLGLRLVLSR
ncbi:LysE family translocator [Hydrogenophaga sp. 5NK40-0174]|uniref:LysE family translocator n=1 Tax=Hydrogenophaga sp. 5NK40-0174 TaxID=3127649 RepID=UPI0033423B94